MTGKREELFLRKLKRYIRSRRMSWQAFAFDRYKRLRNTAHPADFRRLHCPINPGLVSIVLPVYNGERYLHEALDSILEQTYTNFELIAVDDGSSDQSGQILDQYADRDRRIRVIHQSNQRLPRSLSNGFRLARGEFLTWTSDDNRLKPQFLERMVDCLRRHPTWDMVYANPDIIGDNGQPLLNSEWYQAYQMPPGSQHIWLPEDPSELNIDPNNFIGAAFLYRDRVGWLLGDYSPHRFTMEDYDYWMQVNSLFHLRHADFREQFYEYRFHGQSLTSLDSDLGITASRPKMMVFDTFRRDHYLAPLVWLLEENNLVQGDSAGWQKLQELIRSNGNLILDRADFSRQSLPHLWMPTVYAHAWQGSGPVPAPPADLPDWVLRALIAFQPRQSLPDQVPGGWDICLAMTDTTNPPRLIAPFQGWFASDDLQVLFTSVDIRCRVDHLRRIEQEAAFPPQPEMPLSVVVCTYHRGQLLLDNLRALARQTLAKQAYEVLVVNNDPLDLQVEQWIEMVRVEEFADYPDRLRLIACPLPGLSNARNAGIAEARGKVVCFIDDDAIAHPNWLEEIGRFYSTYSRAGVAGGKINLGIPEPRPALLKLGMESLWGHFNPPYDQYTPVTSWWKFPWGGNWFSLRQALMEMGGFRSRYGRVKQGFAGGEEVVAAGLAIQLGYEVGILPTAVVDHCVEPHRFNHAHINRTVIMGITTAYQAQKDLYILRDLSLYTTLRSIIIQSLRIVTSILRLPPRFYQTKMACLHWIGYARLLFEQIGDFFARFRKPISCREPAELLRGK